MKAKTGLFISYVLQIISLFLPWFTYNAKVMGYCWGTQYILHFLIPLAMIGVYLFCVRTGILHVIFAEFGALMYIVLLVLVFGNWQEGRNIVSGFHWGDGFRTAQPGFWLAAASAMSTLMFIQFHVFCSKTTACTPVQKRCALLTVMIVMIPIIVSLVIMNPEKDQLLDATSSIYSHAEIDEAAQRIRNKVNEWDGCKLDTIRYVGDERCLEELDYCNTLNDGEIPYTQCIVFQTDLRSPFFGGGAWKPNAHYDWNWYLARSDGGDWDLLTWGYP